LALALAASWQDVLELMCEQGLGGLAEAMTILINEALKPAIAEMYVQGVTTRKVTAVMQELCGWT
jgi:transposase-like protein